MPIIIKISIFNICINIENFKEQESIFSGQLQINLDMMEWSDLIFIISYVAIFYKCLCNFNIAFSLWQFLYFCCSAKILRIFKFIVNINFQFLNFLIMHFGLIYPKYHYQESLQDAFSHHFIW